MADIRIKDLNEASTPGADYYLLTDSATDGVKKVKTSNIVTKADIGLGDVNNTSDADKPVSTAVQTALDGKATAAQGAKADSAVQPVDLGDLALKDKITVADINATGTPSASTWWRGDGVWSTPAGGGDVVAANNGADFVDAGATLANLGVAIVTSRTAMKELNTSRTKLAWLDEGGRSGLFKWHSEDVSAVVAPRSVTSAGVFAGSNEIVSDGHRFKTGDMVRATASVDGLTAGSYYFVNRTDHEVFTLSSTFGGSIFDLTATDPITLDVVPDSLEGEVVIPTGKATDGSQGAWLRSKPNPGEYYAVHFGLEVGGSTDNSRAINTALRVAEETGGGKVLAPAGDIYMTGGVLKARNVVLEGVSQYATILRWYGTGPAYAVDMRDDKSDGTAYDRTVGGFKRLRLSGSGLSGSSTRGIGIENNQRSYPLTEEVIVENFPNDGIHIAGDNWNVAFAYTQIQSCGQVTSGATGFRIDPDAHVLYLGLDKMLIEGCGNSTSPAGGLFVATNTGVTARSWNIDVQIEGSFGLREAYFENITQLNVEKLYVEREAVSGQTYGVEFKSCTGVIDKGGIYAANGSISTRALIFSGTSEMLVQNTTISGWGGYNIATLDTAKVRYLNCPGTDGSNTGAADGGSSTVTAI